MPSTVRKSTRKKATRKKATSRRVAARPPAAPGADRIEECSTISPADDDGVSYACDLPVGHTGIDTNHASSAAGGRKWYKGEWIGKPSTAGKTTVSVNGGPEIEVDGNDLQSVADELKKRMTVDGADALVVNGMTGEVMDKAAGEKAAQILAPLHELEKRIGHAYRRLRTAESDKKDATAEHKDAQDSLNALVKELVYRTEGGANRQLVLGETAPSTDSSTSDDVAEAEEAPADTIVDEFTDLHVRTLLLDPTEHENGPFAVQSLYARACDARDGGAITFVVAYKDMLRQLREGELVIADADQKASVRTCPECGCTDEYACEGGCTWTHDSEKCSACAIDAGESKGEAAAE